LAALGVLLILLSIFSLREAAPKQVDPVQLPASEPSSAAQPSLDPTPTISPSSSPSGTPTESTEPVPSAPTNPTATAEPQYVPYPKTGDRIGTITMSSLDLSWPIYQGTANSQLLNGVGHYLNSVLPGQFDNTVLAGHRTSVFNRLGELNVGEQVLVKTKAGTFKYKIRKFRIVDRDDRTVIVPTKAGVLTLITCYPFDNIGITTQSFIVVADLQQK
jgi:LPXTG-site transpeptidase (sortase) family protein